MYRHYMHSTPELQRFKPRTFKATLLTPKVDPFLIAVAEANGFKVVIHETQASSDYMKRKRFK